MKIYYQDWEIYPKRFIRRRELGKYVHSVKQILNVPIFGGWIIQIVYYNLRI